MKLVKLFEIGETISDMLANGMGEEISPLPVFKNMAFHQCPSYQRKIRNNAWSWGKAIFDAAIMDWERVNLWKGENATNIVELHLGSKNWTCFEDLYMENDNGVWYPAPQYHVKWREALLEAAKTGSLSATADYKYSPPDGETLEDRCREGRLRINIFQRKTGNLRSFVNMEEVLALIRRYTNRSSIPTISVDKDTPVIEQARAFQAFDVLVTSHGSHLANLIFSQPTTTAIVEILPVSRDRVFYNNAMRANFSYYIISTGHLPAIGNETAEFCSEGEKIMMDNCGKDEKTGIWDCPENWKGRLTGCNILVNMTILETHLKETMTTICGRKPIAPN